MGVLGSGENEVKKFREQGAWLLKGQGTKKVIKGAGSRGIWVQYPSKLNNS